MQFKLGAKVYTSDDQQVGAVSYVVIDPGTKEVTHLVIRKGFLFTKDKVVPVSMVGYADGERIVLQQAARDLVQFPEFEESHYVPAEPEERASEAAPTLIGYPPIGTIPVPAGARQLLETTRNIPEGTVAVKEGARAITSDGHHAGNVERLIVRAEEEDRATHLVISQGLLLKTWKLVPIDWITNVLENEVHLAVDSRFLDSLPEYMPELQA